MFHDMENDITHAHLSFEALSAIKVAETIPHIVWMARPDGYREYFNQRWYAFTKTNREQVHGNGWLQWVHLPRLTANRCMGMDGSNGFIQTIEEKF